MDGCLVKTDVLMRSADAVPVDDWRLHGVYIQTSHIQKSTDHD